MHKARRIGIGAALAGLCLAAAPLAAADPTVRIHDGLLQGAASPDAGVVAFKGIPYAKPPVGDLRWRAPVAAEPWSGARAAKAFGAICPQLPPDPKGLYFDGVAPQSEDCLTLNVWAPKAARKLPVMVWIHGGALIGGSSAEPVYDGTKLAKQGIIFVSINYRVGLYGYLAHPALSAESPQHLSGNYGLLDQIAALRWVRDNIAAFGGDPARVTIAGESAGGLSVMALLASPEAHGLFRGAISESGYMPSYRTLHDASRNLPSAEEGGLALAKAAGLSTAADLRKADLVTLFKAGIATGWQPEPVVDGVTLKRQIAEVFAHGEQAHVPVLAGFNEGEIRSLMFLMPQNVPDTQAAYVADIRKRFGDQADAFLKIYPGVDPKADAMMATRDAIYGWAAQNAVRRGAAIRQPAYLYFFHHSTPTQRARNLAAFHASEIPYIFGQVGPGAAIGPNWPLPPNDATETKLSDAMLHYWVSFVKTGVPTAPGEVAWPRYTLANPAYLDIGDTPLAKRDLTAAAFAWDDALVNHRIATGQSWRYDTGYLAFPPAK